MTNLRKAAKGRECQIRIPGVCCGDNETTVLCHLGGGGMGRKRHDIHGAIGCYLCHDVCDGRRRADIPQDILKLWFLEAVIRTQEIWIDEGLI